MKKSVILLAVMMVIVFAVSPASAIIGGAPDSEHTNVGAIVLRWPAQNYQLARLCTATLIHPRVLVSAAHCFERLGGLANEPLFVTFEQNALFGDPADDPEYLAVEEYIYHPDFITHIDEDDIALVLLEEPVPDDFGIVPQDLPELGFMDTVIAQIEAESGMPELELIMVGYGGTEKILPPNNPDNFFSAERNIGYVTFQDLTSYFIMTYQNLDNAESWYGDSGGPLFYQGEEEVLIGVNGGLGLNHYRLDTKYAQKWIKDTMKDLLED